MRCSKSRILAVFVSNLVFYSGRFDTLVLISAYCTPRGSSCNLKESEGWTMFLSMLPSNNVFAQHPSTRGMLMKWNSHLNKGTRAKENFTTVAFDNQGANQLTACVSQILWTQQKLFYCFFVCTIICKTSRVR
jgi:hypothetical protein